MCLLVVLWFFRIQCEELSDDDTLIDGGGGNESDNEFIRRLGDDNKEASKTVDAITRDLLGALDFFIYCIL